MTVTTISNKVSTQAIQEYRGQLLEWYDGHDRDVPWRAEASDPYRVWLSEIMCQQTTVQAVIPYYTKFLEKWPNVMALAAAEQDEVMAEWAGLGYYARARNLHKCAQVVANDLDGAFPSTQEELKALPGIGDYTSAAIAAIAFGQEAVVVDGNVERVIARFYAVEEALPKAKTTLKRFAGDFYEGTGAGCGHLAQAFMDLGARICIPKAPRCGNCPISNGCEAYAQGRQTSYPVKAEKKPRPKRFGHVYYVEDERERVLLHRREEKGLLGGMLGLPTTEWGADKPDHSDCMRELTPMNTHIHHVFTHFDLELIPHRCKLYGEKLPENHFFADPVAEIENMPTVFKKALKLYLNS